MKNISVADDVWEVVREVAFRRRVAMGEVVGELVRRDLAQPARQAAVVPSVEAAAPVARPAPAKAPAAPLQPPVRPAPRPVPAVPGPLAKTADDVREQLRRKLLHKLELAPTLQAASRVRDELAALDAPRELVAVPVDEDDIPL